MARSTGVQDIALARLWLALSEVKARVDNEIVPLGLNLGVEDPELMIALDTASERIKAHFERFRLVAETRKS